MENNKKRQKHFDRITLDTKTLQIIDGWIAQVKLYKSGVDLSRKDLLNWLVQNLPERLSGSQEKQLAEAHYSELRFLHYAARRIKDAKARGETLTLKDLEGKPVNAKEPGVKRKLRKPKTTEAVSVDISATNENSVANNEILKSTQ
ncbi:MAG: hypothetical protein A4S09_03305 [Proteobacteria bacterium SG_bin7]|nr:MAG: hypothetical protein A4S09_03305 [Proteobacteria bacterium SG_bin7]